MTLGIIARPRPFREDTAAKWEQYLTKLKSLPPEQHGELHEPIEDLIKEAEQTIRRLKAKEKTTRASSQVAAE